MKTVADVVEAFGGPTAFARALGVGVSTASEMKRRASIPSAYWKLLVETAAARGIEGVTYEKLADLHAAAPAGEAA